MLTANVSRENHMVGVTIFVIKRRLLRLVITKNGIRPIMHFKWGNIDYYLTIKNKYHIYNKRI